MKKTPITDVYTITSSVLGVGINGKVVECVEKKTGNKYALKVSRIQWRLCACRFDIVKHISSELSYNRYI
jgi:hypothetical protein